ncbi:hypothetical protein BRD08_00135 [Halobacteriales archaeon SW_10_66_29]|nr:MAG: hypothetical protein BRC66_04780 [Halobacteriales archaeon QH_2_66_30]PSQ39113.1 MAG: hypothetical protein BRD08_00135 [Halobacteriales archaeon SW_10_66_29]
MDPYHPTHVLLVGDPVVGRDEYDRLLVEALVAASEVSETIRIRLDADAFAEEHAEVVAAVDEQLEAVAAGGRTEYRGRSTSELADPLEALLTVDGWQRVHAIGSIRLDCGGRTCLEYLPDHESFTVSEDANSEIGSVVKESLDGHPGGLFPKRTLVEWERDGTAYSVEPPSLCVENTCFALRALADVDPDPGTLSIELSWHDRSGGTLANLVVSMVGAVGATRPDELRFESQGRFEAARDALVRVVDVTGIRPNPE